MFKVFAGSMGSLTDIVIGVPDVVVGVELLVCGARKTTNYCSAKCQKEDWKHKAICKK